jgi:hypothetical protein
MVSLVWLSSRHQETGWHFQGSCTIKLKVFTIDEGEKPLYAGESRLTVTHCEVGAETSHRILSQCAIPTSNLPLSRFQSLYYPLPIDPRCIPNTSRVIDPLYSCLRIVLVHWKR